MVMPKLPLHFLPSGPSLRKHRKAPLTQSFYCAQVKLSIDLRGRKGAGVKVRIKSPASLSSVPPLIPNPPLPPRCPPGTAQPGFPKVVTSCS